MPIKLPGVTPSTHAGEDLCLPRIGERVTLVLIASVVLFARFGPTGEMKGRFHSDAAIPVIMASASTLTIHELYYYGQDAFGSILSLTGWVARQLFGRPWTVELALTLNILLVVWGLAALCKAVFPQDARRAHAALCASVVVLCLALSIRGFFLSIANPYAGQFAFSCLALALLTRGFSGSAGHRRLIGFGLVACAACWLTPASAAALGLASVVLALASRPQRWYERVLPGALICLAAGAERILNATYQQYVRTTYGWAFKELHFYTPFRPMAPDVPYFPTSSRVFFFNFRTGLSGVEIAILLIGAISIIVVARSLIRRTAAPSAVTCRFIVAACTAAALGNFVAVAISSWPQYGGHNYRYLTPTVNFLLLASTIAFVEAIGSVRFVTSRSLLRAGAGLLVLAGIVSIPSYLEGRAAFSALKNTSEQMGKSASAVAVVGDYWAPTYGRRSIHRCSQCRCATRCTERRVRCAWLVDIRLCSSALNGMRHCHPFRRLTTNGDALTQRQSHRQSVKSISTGGSQHATESRP